MLSVKDNPETPRERAWHGALKARMNAIYYQRVIVRCERWDRLFRFGALVLSSGGVVAAVKWSQDDKVAIFVGIVAAIFNAVTLTWGFSERARVAASVLPQYVEHYQRFRNLVADGEGVDAAQVAAAIADLDRTELVEAEKIRASDDKLLKQAHTAVLREIGAAPAS